MSNEDKFKKAPVPAYMMSYGDMMTLLLTFFILLVSMAQEQNAGFVAAGRKSFVRALNSGGLPGVLFSGRRPISLGEKASFFQASSATANSDITKKADGDRRVFDPVENKLRKDFVVQINRGHEMAMPTNIGFEPGTLTLTKKSKKALDQAIRMAQISSSDILVESHVTAKPGRTVGDSFAYSTRRAHVVAEHLHAVGRIAMSRITAVGRGRFQPLVDREERDLSQDNDRVTIIFTRQAQTVH